MITLPVVNQQGEQVSTVELSPDEFGGQINKQLLHDAVVMYQANKRVGTHFTKTRGEVAGCKRKLFRQKGTGNARVGTKRTGKRRGGGVALGPRPRDYSYSIPKKARRLATRMALLSKFQDNEAVIVDALSLEGPKTKDMVGVLGKLGLDGETCLVATNGVDRNVYLSGRNIKGVDILPVGELNAYNVLLRKRLCLTVDALEELRKSAVRNKPVGEEQVELDAASERSE